MSELESALTQQLWLLKIPPDKTEYRFHPVRRWRFDMAWPDQRVAVEVEGGTWAAGRHTRGGGYERDCEKYNSAAELGWLVLRYTSGMIKDGSAASQIERVLGGGPA